MAADSNNPVTAFNDSNSIDEDNVLTVNALSGVLSNDISPTLDTLTVTAVNGSAAAVGTTIDLASGAHLTLNSDGSYIYDPSSIPNIEQLPVGSTPDSFTYTVTDNVNGSADATVAITVNIPAEPVTATDDSGATLDEDTTLSVTAGDGVLANDLHGSDDAITVTEVNGVAADVGNAITLASGATLTLNADGSYSYDPSTITGIENMPVGSFPDSFSYTAADGHGDAATATVAITVNIPAEPVTATDDSGATLDEDTTLSVTAGDGVLANDLHGSDDAITVTEVNGVAADVGNPVTLASGATLTLNADGSYSYDPSTITGIENMPVGSFPDSFSYTAADGHGDASTATVAITVNIPAEPVTATDDSGATLDEDTTLSVTAGDGVLANDLHGSDDAITVTEVNGVAADVGNAITLASGATLTLNADGSYSYDPSTITGIENMPVGSFPDSFSYTAADGHGDASTATVAITVNIPAEPVTATDDSGATLDEDTTLTVTAGDGVLANDLHGSDDAITVTEVNGVAADVGNPVTLASGATLTLNADGSYSYDPSTITGIENMPVGSFPDSFSYTAADGHGDASTATVAITVNIPAEPVTATDDSGATLDEDTTLTVTAGDGVLANDLHGSDDAITVTEVNGVAADVGNPVTLASGATLTLNADGSYSYDPSTITGIENMPVGSFPDSFSYTAADGHGDAATATVAITVNIPAEPVTATDDSGATLDEDTTLTVTAGDGVLANDLHGSDDAITVTEVNGVAADVGNPVTLASGATLTLNADGSYSYDPSTITGIENMPVGSFPDSFSYTAADGHGDASTATVAITVNIPAEPVTATDDSGATLDEDTTLTVTAGDGVLANDLHGSDDAITVTEVNGVAADVGNPVTLASGATLTLNADGSYSYDPSTITGIENMPVGSFPDSFSYTAADGHGDASTATVAITVNIPAEPVTATDDSGATLDEDTTLTVTAGDGVLANDLHGSDDAITVTEVNGVAADVGNPVTLASGATLTLNADGSYSYDPSTITGIENMPVGSFPDSFSYTAADGHGDASTATVAITVNIPAEPVTATDDSGATLDEDTTLTVTAGDGVLANDLHGSDDAITVTEVNGVAADVGNPVTLASGATLTLNADGSYSYDPSTITGIENMPVGSFPDSFSYTAADGHGDASTATVAITVNIPAEPVTATDDSGATLDEDTTLTVTAGDGVLANDLHGSDDAITVTEVNGVAADVGNPVTLASGATLTLNADGSYSYDPSTITGIENMPVGSFPDSFSYTAADGHGDAATATVAITVNIPAEPVTATDDSGATLDEDTTLSVTAGDGVLANDLHGSDDAITVTEVNGVAADVGNPVTLASGATLTLNADGSYSYDPSTITGIENMPVGSFPDSFSYTAADGHGDASTATVAITVNIPAEPVTAEVDTATVDVQGQNNNQDHDHGHHHHHDRHDHCGNGNGNGNSVLMVDAAHGVLVNDNAGSDDPLHVSAVNGSAAGVGTMITLASGAHLTLNSDGSYSYDPSTITILSQLSSGTFHDTFTYTASDGHGDTDSTTVDITVNVAGNNNDNNNHHHHHHHHQNHHDYSHHDDRGGHNDWQSNWGRSHHDIISHGSREIDGHYGEHGNGWQNASSNGSFGHELNFDQHGWDGNSAIALAHLEHGSAHHNFH